MRVRDIRKYVRVSQGEYDRAHNVSTSTAEQCGLGGLSQIVTDQEEDMIAVLLLKLADQ